MLVVRAGFAFKFSRRARGLLRLALRPFADGLRRHDQDLSLRPRNQGDYRRVRSRRRAARVDAEDHAQGRTRDDDARTGPRHIPPPARWQLEDLALYGLRVAGP